MTDMPMLCVCVYTYVCVVVLISFQISRMMSLYTRRSLCLIDEFGKSPLCPLPLS